MDLQALYDQAVAAHRQGDLAGAEEAYSRLLSLEPDNPHVRHPLGVLLAQRGRAEEGLALLEGVMAQSRPDVGLLKDYALVLAGVGRNEEALAVFGRALALTPDDLELIQLRIDVLLRLQRLAEALVLIDQALALRPASAILLHQQGRALAGLGRHGDAERSFARVLDIKPDSDAALYERGAALAAQDRIADWFASFHAFAQRNVRAAQPDGVPHKLRHDEEQRAWQREQGIATGSPLHIEGGERLAGPAINPANADEATRQWNSNRPQVAVVDDLLTPEALAALRRFCMGSDVWHLVHNFGYLGAMPEYGFSVPLLAQIAEEFRSVFSGICGGLPLKYAWAMKYDSIMDRAGIHADDAVVNVNFWITPEDANLDPDPRIRTSPSSTASRRGCANSWTTTTPNPSPCRIAATAA
jgi:Flp pilus assembly protein TadD